MRADALAILCAVLLAHSARAGDSGSPVTFEARSGASFPVRAAGAGVRVVYESGESDEIPQKWDTLLIQGDSPDPAVSFQAARVLPVGSESWRTLEMHRFPNGRFWAKLRAAKDSGPVRLRAVADGATSDHTVSVYSAEVFTEEPAPSAGPAVPPRGPQNPDARRPAVHPRADWLAVPATQPYTPDPIPWRVTLHHSDGKHTSTLAESETEARFIQDFHIHGRGWIDIAYHFLVDSQGNVLEGRPEGVLGAHTLANNEGNVGIVLLGTYHPPVNDLPSKAQLEAVAALGRYLVARYGIDPKSLKGHRDYKQTDCPGDRGYAKLDVLRQAFAGAPIPGAVSRQRKTQKVPMALLDSPSFDGR